MTALHVLRALVEGLLAGALVGGILTFLYNRYLPDLRESLIKKVFSLLPLPLAFLAGGAHVVVLLVGGPVSSFPVWIFGGAITLWQARLWVLERRLNRATRTERVELAGGPSRQAETPLRGMQQDSNPGGKGMGKMPMLQGASINYPYLNPLFRIGVRLVDPLNEATALQLARRTFFLPHLHPAWEGRRLVFLTDFHVHPTLTDDYFRGVVEKALALEPDVILLGGDFISKPPWRHRCAWLLERLRDHPEVYAIRGNHDFWTHPSFFARMLERWGVRLLSNEAVLLERGGGRLALVGLEDPYITLTERAHAGVAHQLDRWDQEHGPLPRLGLVHTPMAYPKAAALGCHAALSGHTHGGQIRLPLFGTTIKACRAPRQFAYGAGQMAGMETFTSNGIGVFFPLRLNCPPQIVEVTLQRAPGK